MKLRPYQQKIINRINEFIKEQENELIIKLFTGLGKTFLMPRIAQSLNQQGYNVLVLSDVMQLIRQLDEHFKNMSLNVSKIVSDERNSSLANITLASEQTLYNRLKNTNKVENLVILYDEAHKRRFGSRFTEIVSKLEPIKLIGFSATPFDMNGVLLFDNIYEPISYEEAIQEGYLTPVRYYIPKIIEQIDFDSIDKGSSLDYSAKDITKLYNTKEFKKWCVEFFYENQFDKKQTLIYTGSIEQAEMVKEWLNSDLVQVVHSKKDSKENQQCIDGFKCGDVKCLISVTSLAVGFDAPNAQYIINLRPTKSIPLFHQIVGRLHRIYNDKDFAYFYDITDCLIRFGLPEEFEPFRTKQEAKEWLTKNTLVESYLKASKDEMIEIDTNILKDFKIRLEELKSMNLHILSTEQLRQLYYSTTEPRKLVLILNEYYRRFRGFSYRTKTLEWIISEIEKYLVLMERFNKSRSFLKAMKTRGANLLKQGKKLPALGHFAGWFYKQQIEKYGLENLKFWK